MLIFILLLVYIESVPGLPPSSFIQLAIHHFGGLPGSRVIFECRYLVIFISRLPSARFLVNFRMSNMQHCHLTSEFRT